MIELFQKADPDDVVPLMGRARLLLFKAFNDEGEELLRKIISKRPDIIEAHAQLGVVIVSESREQDFLDWHANLPPEADGHPEIWWVRATQARREGRTEEAIRCAWEALKLDPNHLGATFQLAQLLGSANQPKAAQAFADRASRLELLATNLHDVLLREGTPERMLRCAGLCEELGRIWEAWGWHIALKTHHRAEAQEHELQRLEALLTRDMPQTLPAQQLASQFDYSHYPLPAWSREAIATPETQMTNSSAARFEDVAAAVGLMWRYENGAPATGPGFMVYQSIGGGAAAVDFDADGLPDLYLPQASDVAPLEEQPPRAMDSLIRNVRGQAVDVSTLALPGSYDYGFGVGMGDFDGDGFQDLYIANAQKNTLLHNRGDGTFEQSELPPGENDRTWSASTLIVDLNGDGLPDLYDVNYCGGERPFTHICLREDSNIARTCIPTEFQAADDRLLLNRGDGTFEDVSADSGILVPEGRGLGIIAAQFDSTPGLDLYVTNDMSANFLFLNRTDPAESTPKFTERGVISGTAYDSDGRPQASMGIAADDADGDGLLDLFLTHFFNESNTFYRQQPGQFFTDDTAIVGLRVPSMQTLGFGTQFLDADLDGWPDLVVTNGHVDDFTESGMPFQMKPQFFSNLEGSFTEVAPEGLGDFFMQESLGRGLARLDWNRDLRDDFVVSRLLDNASLVLNRTELAGNAIAIRLSGRQDRDAIGTRVTVTIDGREIVRQMVGGDGFACSNERQMIFGLGDAAVVDSVKVEWPSGGIAEAANLNIDARYHFVESRPEPFLLPQDN